MGLKSKQINENHNKKEFENKSRACKNARSKSYLSEDQNYKPFSTQLAKIGLEIRDITGDGNCCFRALSDQMEGHENQHLEYRRRVCQYMKQNSDEFEPFIAALIHEEEENGKKSNKRQAHTYENYIRNLETPGTYADNGCLVAFARLYQLNINIHQLDLPIWTINGSDGKSIKQIRQLHLAYHNGEHYSSIRIIGDKTNNPTDINFDKSSGSKKEVREKPKRELKNQATSYHYEEDELYDNSLNFSEAHNMNVDQIINVTNCHDINRINEKLKLNNNDVEATINSLLAELDLEDVNISKAESDMNDKSGAASGRRNSKKIKIDKKREKKTRQMERQRLKVIEQRVVTNKTSTKPSELNESLSLNSIASNQMNINADEPFFIDSSEVQLI